MHKENKHFSKEAKENLSLKHWFSVCRKDICIIGGGKEE